MEGSEVVCVHSVSEPVVPAGGTKVHYSIESAGSTFTVRAFSAGLLSAFAHDPTIVIPHFEGDIYVAEPVIAESSVTLVIHSASLRASGDIAEKDRKEIDRKMREEVLETDSFPDILYECAHLTASRTGEGQYWVALNGELSMHGVKRSQPVSARVSMDGDLLKAAGDFSIRQSDYEIAPVSAVGGTIKLKDELKLSFNISARRRV